MPNDKFEKELLADMNAQADQSESLITPAQNAELDAEIEMENKYGDQSIQTFVESAASGASFGISDQVLTKTGLASKEALRERRKRNEASAITGEVAGVLGSAILSGGESLIAKGIGAGVKSAAKAGVAVENLTANTIKKLIADTGKKSLAKEVLKKGIAKGAGSAVEGSFYGMGKLISEEALGNEDFNAENFLAHAGTGALFGGIVGGTLGAIQAAVPVIRSSKAVKPIDLESLNTKFSNKVDPVEFKNVVDKFTKSSDMARANIHPYTPEEYKTMQLFMSPDGKSGYAIKGGNELVSVFSTVKGRGDDIVQHAIANGARKLDAFNINGKLPELYGKHGFKVTAKNAFNEEFADMTNPVLVKSRPEYVEMAIKDEPKVDGWVTKKLKGIMNPARNAQELAGSTPTEIYKMKQYNPKLYEHTPEMLREVMGKKGLGVFSSNKKLFNSMKDFITETGEEIGKSLDDITGVLEVKGALPTRARVANRIVSKLDELTAQFKDGEGRVLAGASSKVNKIESIIAEFDDDLVSNQIMPAKTINELKSKYQKLAKWDYKGNLPLEEEVSRAISRALREEIGDLAVAAGGELGAKLDRQMLNYGAAQEFMKSFGKKLDTQKNSSFINYKDMLLSGFLGKSGVLVAGTAKAIQSDFKKRLMILTGIEKANKAVDKQINSKVSGFFYNAPKAYVPVVSRTLSNSQFSKKYEEGVLGKAPKTKEEAYKNISDNLQELASDPDKLLERIQMSNIDEAAPLAAQQAQVTLANGIQFLLSKLPKDSRTTGVLTNLRRQWTPSTIEVAKFEKYVAAVENPMSVLDEIEAGMVTRESIEALEAVYPNLYMRIQEKVMQQIVKNPESIDYKKRLSLGIVLNISTDSALDPNNIRALQSHFSEAQESQSGGAIGAVRADKLSLAESEASGVTKISNRRDLD